MSEQLCGQINSNLSPNCNAIPVQGMESYGYIINYVDWLNATITESNGIISAITLPAGKYAYKVQVPPNYTKERYSGEKGDSGYTYYTHECDILIEPTNDGKQYAKNLGNGKYIFIAEKKAKGVDKQDAFDLMGNDTALEGTVITFDSDANNGHILATLASPEARESEPPKTVFTTDYATTVALLEGLLASAATTTAA